MKTMTKVERIKAAVKKQPTDKLPYSFWTHFPDYDQDPALVAQKTYEFFKEYDIDFIKMMNNGMYSTVDFGCEQDSSQVKSGGATFLTKSPIQCAEDWTKLRPVDIHKGVYGRELEHLKRLVDLVKGEAPIVFTVFTPISTAVKIAMSMGKTGDENMFMSHIKEGHGEEVKQGLEVITEVTERLAEEVISLGADGIFFASQMASYKYMEEETYEEFGKPYDLRVLDAAKNGWFNMIHAHGDHIMLNLLKDYPVDCFNYHAYEGLPTPRDVSILTGKCIVGGLERDRITGRDYNSIIHNIVQSIEDLGGIGHILTPGCVVHYPLDEKTLAFIRQAKEEIEVKMGLVKA